MRNYKTTISGLVLAICLALQPIVVDGFDLKKDWLKFLLAINVAVFGFFAKDHDVTGKNS